MPRSGKGLKWAVLILASLAAAFLWWGGYTALVYHPVMQNVGETLRISGKVMERDYYGGDLYHYILQARFPGSRNVKVTTYLQGVQASYGDTITFTARMDRLSEDQEASFRSRGIYLAAKPVTEDVPPPVVSARSRLDFVSLIRSYKDVIAVEMKNACGIENGALATAMLTGDTSGLPEGFSGILREAGASHVTSVSGLHLGAVTGALSWLLERSRLLRRRKGVKNSLLALAVLVFMALSGFSFSVVRSGFMYLYFLLARTIARQSASYNGLAAAVIGAVLPNPYYAVNVGFLLSVTACASILFLSPILRPFRQSQQSGRLRRMGTWFASTLAVSFAVTLGTSAVGGFVFSEISLAGIFSNFLFIPLSSAIVVLSGAFAMTGCLLTPIGLPLSWLTSLFYRSAYAVADWNVPMLQMEQGYARFWLAGSVVCVVLILLVTKKAGLKRAAGFFASAVSVAVLFAACAGVYAYQCQGQTEITVIDSEKASAAVIVQNGCATVVFLRNPSDAAYDVRRVLRRSGCREVTVACLAEGGGTNAAVLSDTLRGMRLRTVMLPDPQYDAPFLKLGYDRLVPLQDTTVDYASSIRVQLSLSGQPTLLITAGEQSVGIAPSSQPASLPGERAADVVLYYGGGKIHKELAPLHTDYAIIHNSCRDSLSFPGRTLYLDGQAHLFISRDGVLRMAK